MNEWKSIKSSFEFKQITLIKKNTIQIKNITYEINTQYIAIYNMERTLYNAKGNKSNG